jgi:cobalt-zinc-cadmium efflux system outer membrane protein
MRIVFTICLIVAVASLSLADEIPPHHAAGTNAVQITPAFINQLAEELRTNHPALRAAGARADAAEANAAAVRSWEDPTLRLGGVGARREFRASDGDLIYGVEQKLPLFGKPQLARKIAQSEFATEQANTNYQFQILRRELAKSLLKTALADCVVEIGEQDLAWLDPMATATEQRYRAGAATQVQLLRVQTEQAKRADQLRTDKLRLNHQQFELNRMLNRDLHAPWPRLELPQVASPVVYNQRLVNLAVKNEPKLKVMQQQIKQAEATAQLTRRKRLPDVSLGFEGRNYTGDGSFRQDTVMISFNLPWVNFSKYRNDIRRDEAKLKAAELDATDYELSVHEEIHHLTVSIDAARREALLYRDEIMPRAEQALNSARYAWETDKGMFADILEARRMTLEGRLMYARAVAEQYEMMAELVLCCGLGDFEALQMIGVQTEPAKSEDNKP